MKFAIKLKVFFTVYILRLQLTSLNNNNYNVHLEITNAYDGRHRNKQGV